MSVQHMLRTHMLPHTKQHRNEAGQRVYLGRLTLQACSRQDRVYTDLCHQQKLFREA